ncbi:MAG: outer membrane lipoprotein-sorting protein [Rhodospirillales bacterium]|jgi:outer membrane lipoprotein-sorting protein|nr:outer membrane lipoprotein-sorting protein [Rhodospirillales bacterium]MBT4039674.1 outer membrane lipoprotein-sorting protein [Rhodospirillales bacterium]MBT4626452.1 outer membrane lipoprotein-sorting protein [Rhodospirillales bacterium]MBT5350865.1 outer membrane lipoprotein-sorting protein [Rhodospirillales bacterium]MBT5520695.1 outer membrane lipoprotein-sorting protein [Rhodospirillales bacterium]
MLHLLPLNKSHVIRALALVAVVSTAPAFALTSEEQGFDVAARSDRSDRGFTDSRVSLKMILRNSAGQESIRELSLTTFEMPDEQVGDKSITVFDSPADIDGTALLSHSKILDADDQWLYLPALKRIKRISSVNKSGPFVGSEFAFEDFTGLELNKYAYRYLDEEACGDLLCDVIERTPLYEHSGYSRQVAWVDQTDFQARKIDFYDRRGDLLKTLEQSNWTYYQGKYWRAHLLSMRNHQTGKSTELVFGEFSFQNGLSEQDFVKSTLKRLQ